MLTPQHSFGSISQRNRCVLPGNARGANDDLRRRCAYAIYVACALAHLDRGADPALRAFKNGSRHDVADRIFAPSKPQLFTLRLEAEQQCAARCMLACGAGLFVRSVGKFQTAEQIACCGAERAFRSPNGLKRLTVSARFSIAVRLFRPARLRPIPMRSHSAAFARYSSFLFMGVFRQWLSFVNRQTCRLFQLQRYFRTSRRRAPGTTFAPRQAALTSLSDFSCDRGPTAAVGSAARREASPA
jgi:hypothetical protein